MVERDLLGAPDLDGAAGAAGDLDGRVAEVELDRGQVPRTRKRTLRVSRVAAHHPTRTRATTMSSSAEAGDEPPPWRRPPGGAWQSNG